MNWDTPCIPMAQIAPPMIIQRMLGTENRCRSTALKGESGVGRCDHHPPIHAAARSAQTR